MKIIFIVAKILWILSIPVLIISSTVNFYTCFLPLYRYGFEKYNIGKVTHISAEQLDQAAVMMVRYLGGQSDTPQLIVDKNGKAALLYNEKELIHLADVRVITDIFRILLVVSLITLLMIGILLFYRSGTGQLTRGLRYGAIIMLVFTGVLIVWAVLDFDSLFYLFHILSFNNDLWLLDPAHDYLIMMFPQGFFNDATMLIVGTIIFESVLLLFAATIIPNILLKQKTKA